MNDQPRPLPPKPVPDADTQPHWDGVAERRLLVQRCGACEAWIWQPKPMCPFCRADGPVWTEVTGNGRVASWTVVHPPVLPVWADDTPFTILLVELDQGVRLVGQLVDDAGRRIHGQPPDALDFEAPVILRWRTDEAGEVLPAWTVAP